MENTSKENCNVSQQQQSETEMSSKSGLLFAPRTQTGNEALTAKIPRYLRNIPVKRIVHPMDQNIAGSFCLSVLFVSVAMVTGLPLVAALLLLLPVALGLRYSVANCCYRQNLRGSRITSRGSTSEDGVGARKNNRLNNLNPTCACCCARTKMVSSFDSYWLNGFDKDRTSSSSSRNGPAGSIYPTNQRSCSIGTPVSPQGTRVSVSSGSGRVKNNPACVAHCLMYLDPGISTDCIRDLVQTRLILKTCEDGTRAFSRFTQRVVNLSSGYVWVEDADFSMDWHVRQEAVKVSRSRQLRLYLSYLMRQNLNPDRPLWEIRVLPQVGKTKNTVLVIRVHHALSDGVALVKILANSLTDHSHLLRLKPRFGGATFPLNVFRALVVGPLTFLGWLLTAKKDFNLLRHEQPVSGERVVAWSSDLRLSKIHRIKQITRSTINDVLVAAITGCIRDYFRRHGITHPPDVTVSLPIDLRYEPSSPETIPDMSNGYAMVTCSLPTNTEGSIPRLWEVRHRMEDLKTSADPVVMYGAVNFLLSLLPEGLAQWLLGKAQGKATLTYCNLPGPEEPVVLGTHRVKKMVIWMASKVEVPLAFSFCSYAGGCCVSMSADKDIIPDGRVIIKEVVAQIERLARLLSKRRIPGEHRRRSSFTAERRQEEIFKPSVQEIQERLHRVQDELHEITQRLEMASMRPEECAFAFDGQTEISAASKAFLCRRVEELKEEFSELLTELRRRKTMHDGTILEEEDMDGELRRPRRRALSSASAVSVVGMRRASMSSVTAITPLMSTSRPLTTPNIAHHRRAPMLLNSGQSACNSPGPAYSLVGIIVESTANQSEQAEHSSPGSAADQQRALLANIDRTTLSFERVQYSNRRHSDYGGGVGGGATSSSSHFC